MSVLKYLYLDFDQLHYFDTKTPLNTEHTGFILDAQENRYGTILTTSVKNGTLERAPRTRATAHAEPLDPINTRLKRPKARLIGTP